MLTASAVDAMLQDKGYTEESFFSRIRSATNNHLITKEVADWAHEVRLAANDQRHADSAVALTTAEDAKRMLEFAKGLAHVLYVLPAMVAKGRAEAKPESGEIQTIKID